jgi:L-alanine-DL-glutamate epimerase-like enolase superfamily enzyme
MIPPESAVPETDVRIKEVSHSYEDFNYRTPIKFGGVALDKVTILNVRMVVETEAGKRAVGMGSMPLGNVWAWPSKELSYDETLAGMKAAAEEDDKRYLESKEFAHPVRHSHSIEPSVIAFAHATGMPVLAGLVVNSAFDAALHDAFGKAHGLNCYQTYGTPFFDDDLGDYLGAEFRGERLHNYLSKAPQQRMPLYHLVGALDPLTPADVKQPVNDGMPETLGDWIRRDGLTHLKIKLNGDDLGWDVERVLAVDRVAEETRPGSWWYSLDFNERCRNVEYLLEFLRWLRDRNAVAFDRVQYIEQPTARDLKANPENKMHEAAKLRPVVIDESLLDLETLMLARDLGYTGVAFKACKGQSQSLLLAAAAQKFGMFRCVQDLTCPGASLIHSAGLAAHIPGVAAIESNSRQYVPAANEPWMERFPGIFRIADGAMKTGLLTGPGLGAYELQAI